ncbi:MAG: hypothetical protein V1778_00655 [bacterium]
MKSALFVLFVAALISNAAGLLLRKFLGTAYSMAPFSTTAVWVWLILYGPMNIRWSDSWRQLSFPQHLSGFFGAVSSICGIGAAFAVLALTIQPQDTATPRVLSFFSHLLYACLAMTVVCMVLFSRYTIRGGWLVEQRGRLLYPGESFWRSPFDRSVIPAHHHKISVDTGGYYTRFTDGRYTVRGTTTMLIDIPRARQQEFREVGFEQALLEGCTSLARDTLATLASACTFGALWKRQHISPDGMTFCSVAGIPVIWTAPIVLSFPRS